MLVVAGISGWIFRRLGLSAVVGYLVAGIIIGPFTPPFTLVTDVERIETLTDLGLAFLMFFVGLGLSLKRIQRLGIGVVATTGIAAFVVFQLCQGFAVLMGWDDTMAFIFAAMLMTSSSAIITKMLAESRLTHERFAQNAQGVTVLEDIVAIVLLTILGSRLHLDSEAPRQVGDTLYLLVGFTALVVVLGLIFVPRVLKGFGRAGDSDLNSVLVCGLVFLAGVASIRAGFSVALGAFLFGVVVAETKFKSRIEKSLAGVQDMFSAIFFVAIGMLIDLQAFVDNAGLILGIAAFAIMVRTVAASIGFVLTGNALPLAVGSAVVVTPIGEFAYVIAQIGVGAEAVPSSFYAVAVGVSIVTAVCAPFFAKNAERLGAGVERLQPLWLERILARYRDWLDGAAVAFSQNHVWNLTRRRTGIAIVQLVVLGGLLGFANALKDGLGHLLQRASYEIPAWESIYWIVVIVITLTLAVAIWQNIYVLCMVYADALTMRSKNQRWMRAVTLFVLQTVAASTLALGVWLAFPIRAASHVLLTGALLVPLILFILLWRRLRALGLRLEHTLTQSDNQPSRRSRVAGIAASGGAPDDWGLDVAEFFIPEDALCVGRTVRDLAIRPNFGCSILEIDRQGYVLDRIRPDEILYPGDRLLLVGTADQVEKTRLFLSEEGVTEDEESDFVEAILDTVTVPETATIGLMKLADARIFDETGVQVMGIDRAGQRIMNPSGQEVIESGDRLLIMGSAVEIRAFRGWIVG